MNSVADFTLFYTAPVDGSVTPTDFKVALSSSRLSLELYTVNIHTSY